MAKNECANCGNMLSSNERKCKYCGTANEYFVNMVVLPENKSENLQNKTEEKKVEKTGSVFVFFVLLFCCWPIAVLYAIINFRK